MLPPLHSLWLPSPSLCPVVRVFLLGTVVLRVHLWSPPAAPESRLWLVRESGLGFSTDKFRWCIDKDHSRWMELVGIWVVRNCLEHCGVWLRMSEVCRWAGRWDLPRGGLPSAAKVLTQGSLKVLLKVLPTDWMEAPDYRG